MAVLSAQVATNTSTTTQLIQAATFLNREGTVGDPIPVVIENQDATNPVFLGNSTVASNTGLKLAAAASLAFEFVGTDAASLYAISTGAGVTVGVLAGRQ